MQGYSGRFIFGRCLLRVVRVQAKTYCERLTVTTREPMDIASVIGILTAVGAVISSFWMEGGKADSVFLVAPMILVVGGTIGVSIVGANGHVALNIPTYLRISFFGREENNSKLIDKIVHIAERSRREGVLSLERELKTLSNRFFAKATLLVIDGVDANTLRDVLYTEISYLTQRHQRGIDLFNRMGGFSPTLGILGTVLALVHTLGSVNNPDKMAAAIASAFIATLWGVGMANIVYIPIADKLRARHEDEVTSMELIAEGVLAIQAGETPRLIRRRLQSFLSPSTRDAEM